MLLVLLLFVDWRIDYTNSGIIIMYRHISTADRWRAVVALEAGESLQTVANRLGVGKATMHRLKRKWELQQTVERTPGTGRQRATTAAEDNALVNFIREQPFETVVNAREATGFPGAIRTARNRVKDADLKCYRAAQKPFLSEANKEARLRFAEEYIEQPPDFWHRVIFSDEKSFQSFHNGPVKVYRPRNERFHANFIQPTFNSGRFSVNVWGWISYQGPGECWQIEGPLTGQNYRTIIENIMLPSVNILYPDENFIFQQVSIFIVIKIHPNSHIII